MSAAQQPGGAPWRELKRHRYEREDWGEGYDLRYAAGLNELNTLVEWGWIAARLPEGPMLDAAAGTGRFALRLRETGHPVLALDGSPKMLQTIRGKRPDLPLLRADLYRLPLADGTFAAVTCMHALFHLPDWPLVLGELARVLRPGGLIFFEMRSGEHVRLAERTLRLLRRRDPRAASANDPAAATVHVTRTQVFQALRDCSLAPEGAFSYDLGHSYCLRPLAGLLERFLGKHRAACRLAAALELALGRWLPPALAYRTLYLGRKR